MTDNEIKNSLKFIAQYCHDEYNEIRVDELLLIALDLINRQQAEVERLQKKVEELSEVLSDTIRIRYSEAKSEAIKEFAERLKEKQKQINITYNLDYDVVFVSEIDNLVKEMVGDKNENESQTG